jgi:hypothetical protein
VETIIGTVVLVLVTVGIGVLADRKLGLMPRPEALAEERPAPPTHAAGEAAATAIRASGTQLERLRASQRCRTCRAALVESNEGRVRYDDRELVVIELHCPRCETKRALYIDPTRS